MFHRNILSPSSGLNLRSWRIEVKGLHSVRGRKVQEVGQSETGG
jgi:hypothetical protein